MAKVNTYENGHQTVSFRVTYEMNFSSMATMFIADAVIYNFDDVTVPSGYGAKADVDKIVEKATKATRPQIMKIVKQMVQERSETEAEMTIENEDVQGAFEKVMAIIQAKFQG